MIPDPHPLEDRRLAELSDYDLPEEGDAEARAALDELAALAAQVCEAPIATVSLVGEDAQWFRGRVGTDDDSTPRSESVCAHAILGDGLLEIPDTTLDPRTERNAQNNGRIGMRFYAGAPIVTPSGLPLGTLCVVDREPRRLTEPQRFALETLARQAMTQLEMRRALRAEREATRRAEHQADELARALDAAQTLKLEIDHRVKNSLQLVTSLLHMQASRSPSEEVRSALSAARGRVGAITAIHAALNDAAGTNHVVLRAYAERIVDDLRASAPSGVEIALEADEIVLRTSQASALAILINEFVTNSIKYAFPDGRSGQVRLAILRDGGAVRVRFSDDGVGQSVEAGRPAHEGLGTRIMRAVGQQLGASLEFASDATGGTALAFAFPLEAPR